MSDKKKDVIVRAVKTFWQATLAYILVNLQSIINLIPDGWEAMKPVLISCGVGALAAGISAVYNGLLAPLFVKKEDTDYSGTVK